MSDDKRMISTSILTATADAIRAKDGSAEPIKPSEFAEKIAAIPSGGGEVFPTVTYTSFISYGTLSPSSNIYYWVAQNNNNFKIPIKNVYKVNADGLTPLENGTYTLYIPRSSDECGSFTIETIEGIRYLVLKSWILNYSQFNLEPMSSTNYVVLDLDWAHVNFYFQSSRYVLIGQDSDSNITSTNKSLTKIDYSSKSTNAFTTPCTASPMLLPLCSILSKSTTSGITTLCLPIEGAYLNV